MAEDGNEKVEEIEELRYMQQIYQNQYEVLNNSINMHLQDMQALNSAQKTLENNGLIGGKEMLTHAGASVYFRAEIKDANHVVVGIGGNYLIEKSVDDAKGYLSKLIAKRTETINHLIKSRRELQAALIDVSYKIEKTGR